MIQLVTSDNILQAAEVYCESWMDSHKSFCSEDFLKIHTLEYQKEYLQEKIKKGISIYMSIKEKPVGIVSVNGSVIENLYVLPREQNKGYGTELLMFAIRQCPSTPVLWILENNRDAQRLYERHGFCLTGKSHRSGALSELELILKP